MEAVSALAYFQYVIMVYLGSNVFRIYFYILVFGKISLLLFLQ